MTVLDREGPSLGFVLVKAAASAQTFKTVGRRPQAQTERVRPVCALSVDQMARTAPAPRGSEEASAAAMPFMSLVSASLSSATPCCAVPKEGSSQLAGLAPNCCLSGFKF